MMTTTWPARLSLLAVLILFGSFVPACDNDTSGSTSTNGNGHGGDPPDPGEPHHLVRLAVEPESLWLSAPGEAAHLSTYERYSGGLRVESSAATFESLDNTIVEVNAQGFVEAVGYGETHVRIAHGELSLEVPVRVAPDLLMTHGFAGPAGPVELWQLDRFTLNANDTGTALGSDDGFYGGVVFLEAYGDYVYAIGSFPGPDYDTVYKLDPVTGTIVDAFSIHSTALGISSQDASASSIAFIDPQRAYITHRFADAQGDFTVSVFNPTTMTLTERIVVAPVTANDPYFVQLLPLGNLLLLLDSGYDSNNFAFGTPQIYAIDAATHTLVDLDPSNPGSIDTISLSGINPVLEPTPGGKLLGICMGDGFALVDMVVDVLNPHTFAIEQTLTFDAPINGGPRAWDHTGRLYIGDSYGPNIVTLDGYEHTILRDASAAITLSGEFNFVASLKRTQDNGIALSTPEYGSPDHLVRRFKPELDTNVNQPAMLEAVTPDAPGHIAAPRIELAPVYATHVIYANNLVAGEPADALGAPTASGGASPSAAVELDAGGEIVLSFGDRWIVNRPGADFVVFGDATLTSGAPDFEHLWRTMHPGQVAVSQDGVTWHTFPTSVDTAKSVEDATRYEGAFGVTPTWLTGAMSPASLAAGGDRFDLRDVGLEWARYVRLSGLGARVDAVAAVHHAMD